MPVNAFKIVSTATVFSLLITGFQNCSVTHFVYDDASFSSKAIDGNETITSTDPGPPIREDLFPGPPAADTPQVVAVPDAPVPMDESDEFADFYRGICKELQNVTLPLMISPNAPDLTVKNTFRSVVIEEGRNVVVKNHVSQTRVHKSATLRLQNLGGKTIVSSNEVLSAENIIGRMCINAVKVGTIHNVANNTKVIANEINEISNIVGDLHIYRARVSLLKNSIGRICLHDGAQILNYSNSYAKVGDCR